MTFLQIALTALVSFLVSRHQIQQAVAAALQAHLLGQQAKFPRVALTVHVISLWVGIISFLAFVWSLPSWF